MSEGSWVQDGTYEHLLEVAAQSEISLADYLARTGARYVIRTGKAPNMFGLYFIDPTAEEAL